MAVIDAVHDLIDGVGSEERLASSIRDAFVLGGSGVWENAGKWLRKSSTDYPVVLGLWSEFASHGHAEVRFRTACFLDEMPQDTYRLISSALLVDRSTRVARMAAARVAERGSGA
ncbi:hypothetical protein [Marilutibacter chinensis]|uniref:HEAT repeat domain-containing protein n=1 Tax=Marilutibacter chinensis TaxID=2912247 RepID=A0ABS9HYG5_9GAMM|nr:hypothetical protein [Lysobacter chinensis]MCF7223413.1 hypothetical protein [Lysobacter chinensis]